MTDKIKFQRVDPFGQMTLSDAERLARFMAGEWVPSPIRWITREEFEREYPGFDAAKSPEEGK